MYGLDTYDYGARQYEPLCEPKIAVPVTLKIIILLLFALFSQTTKANENIDSIVYNTLKIKGLDSIKVEYLFPKYDMSLLIRYCRVNHGNSTKYYLEIHDDTLKIIKPELPEQLSEEQFTRLVLDAAYFKSKDIYAYRKRMSGDCESDLPILWFTFYNHTKKPYRTKGIEVGDIYSDKSEWIGSYTVKFTKKFKILVSALEYIMMTSSNDAYMKKIFEPKILDFYKRGIKGKY